MLAERGSRKSGVWIVGSGDELSRAGRLGLPSPEPKIYAPPDY